MVFVPPSEMSDFARFFFRAGFVENTPSFWTITMVALTLF